MSFEEAIIKDIEELDNLSNSNMDIRKKIIYKLEAAVDTIDFTKVNEMKATKLMAVNNLISTLNSTLNDTEDSRLKVLKSKQKTVDNKENKEDSKIVVDFLRRISEGVPMDNEKIKETYYDETKLDGLLKERDIKINEDESDFGELSETKITKIVEEMS